MRYCSSRASPRFITVCHSIPSEESYLIHSCCIYIFPPSVFLAPAALTSAGTEGIVPVAVSPDAPPWACATHAVPHNIKQLRVLCFLRIKKAENTTTCLIVAREGSRLNGNLVIHYLQMIFKPPHD